MQQATVPTVIRRLIRDIDALRLGAQDTVGPATIRGHLIDLRDLIHGDEASALAELYGPLGALGRLVDEWYQRSGDSDGWAKGWLPRWHEALDTASLFLHRLQ